jgi:hypothetical protein
MEKRGERTLRTPLSVATHNASFPFVGISLTSPGSRAVSARIVSRGLKPRKPCSGGVNGDANGDEA